jgi:hypothetical protein
MPTLGSDSFATPNPDFGATITFYLDEAFQTGKEKRQTQEKSLAEKGEDIPFPGWDRLTAESLEVSPRIMVLVSDTENQPVRWLEAENKKGVQRISWDLRLAPPDAIDLTTPEFVPPWAGASQGPLVAPGGYSAQLYAIADNQATALTDRRGFNVKPVRSAANGIDYARVAAYQQKTAELIRQVKHAGEELGRTKALLSHMKAAAVAAPRATPELFNRLDAFGMELEQLSTRLNGDRVRGRLNETSLPSISDRAFNAANNWQTTQKATATQMSDYEIAKKDFSAFEGDLDSLLSELQQLEASLSGAGAPSWR